MEESDPHTEWRRISTDEGYYRRVLSTQEMQTAELHAVSKHAAKLERENKRLLRALRGEHALLTKHLDAEGYSGVFPDWCPVCALLAEGDSRSAMKGVE